MADLHLDRAAQLNDRFGYLEGRLAGRDFVHGDRFTVADAYLFTILGWTRVHHIDLTPYPTLQGYLDRIGARPRVRQALQEEGLLEGTA